MSTSEAIATRDTSPTDSLKARLKRLASDPRVHLIPDGRQIMLELGMLLADIDDVRRRVAAIERFLAVIDQRKEEFE